MLAVMQTQMLLWRVLFFGPYSLTRFNMYPAITINGQARNGVSSGQAMTAMEQISDEVLPKDMGYAWSGSSLQEKESSGQIGPILAMSLVFIYLFLSLLCLGFWLNLWEFLSILVVHLY